MHCASDRISVAAVQSHAAIANVSIPAISEQGAWAVIERMLSVQAGTLGATDIFYMSAVLFLALIALVWMTKPAGRGAPVDAGGAH